MLDLQPSSEGCKSLKHTNNQNFTKQTYFVVTTPRCYNDNCVSHVFVFCPERMGGPCLVILSLVLLLTSGETASECIYITSKTFIITIFLTDLNITATDKVQPNEMNQMLKPFSILVCSIQGDFEISSNTVDSTWITPSGVTVLIPGTSDNKYVLTQGEVVPGFDSVLLVQDILYNDEGTYICRVRDIRNTSNLGPWIEAPLNLQLLGEKIGAEMSHEFCTFLFLLF